MNMISAFADAVVVEEDGSIRNSAPAGDHRGSRRYGIHVIRLDRAGFQLGVLRWKGKYRKGAGSRQRAETAAEMRYGSTQIRRRVLW